MSYSGTAMEQLTAHMRLGNIAAGGDAMGKPDIAANGRAMANGDATQDGGTCVNDDIIFNDGMSRIAFDKHPVIIFLETFGTQGNGLVHANMSPDNCGFAYDHAGAMVDKETLANLRTGMNVNSCGGMSNLGNNAGNQRRA